MKGRLTPVVISMIELFAAILLSTSDSNASNCEKATQLYNQAAKAQGLTEKESLLKQALVFGCGDNNVSARIFNNLADVYEKQGHLERAIDLYRKAINADPSFSTPYLSLADICTNLGKSEEAARYYDAGFLLENFKSREQIVAALSPNRAIRVVPSVTLYFGLNRAELGTEADRQLKALLEALKGQELQPYRFRLAGHTCSLGTEQYNQTLSEYRATAVREWLESHGISKARLISLGFGESRPDSDNSSEDGRRRNRRVEIRTIGATDVEVSRATQNQGLKEAFALLIEGERLLIEEIPEKAAEKFRNALELFEKANFRKGISAALDDLILSYRYMGDWNKAEYYRTLALQ